MSLKKKAINGGKWSAVSTIFVLFLQTLQISVVSRLLDPTSMGLMAIVLVVIGFAQTFSDMGISNAIIQRKNPTKDQLSSLYWLNVLAGIAVFIVIFVLKHLIADFFKSPDLVFVLTLTATMFLIIPFGQQFQILLQKELKFKELAVISIVSMFLATLVTILLVYSGFGIYALVGGQLTNCFVMTLILCIFGWRNWRPSLHFKKEDLKGYLSFGLFQIGEKTVTYFNNSLDTIMIGKFLGAEALGYYTIAYNLIIIPLTKINPIINRVAFPVFSIIQDDGNRLKSGYLKVLHILSLINFPLYFGLFVIAPLLIPFLFGEHWTESIIITQILCGVGLLRTIANPVGSLVMAKGRSDLGFGYNSFKSLLQIPIIYLGAHFGGVVGVALALLGLKLFYFILNYIILIRELLGATLKSYLSTMRYAFVTSIFMAFCVWIIGELVSSFSEPAILAIQIIIGIFMYISMAIFFKPELAKTVLKIKSNTEGRVST